MVAGELSSNPDRPVDRQRPGQHPREPHPGQPRQRRRRRPAVAAGRDVPDRRRQQHHRQQHLGARGRRHRARRLDERPRSSTTRCTATSPRPPPSPATATPPRPGCRPRTTATSCRPRCRPDAATFSNPVHVQQRLLGQPGRHLERPVRHRHRLARTRRRATRSTTGTWATPTAPVLLTPTNSILQTGDRDVRLLADEQGESEPAGGLPMEHHGDCAGFSDLPELPAGADRRAGRAARTDGRLPPAGHVTGSEHGRPGQRRPACTAPSIDYDGQTRPVPTGSAYDAGMDERSSTGEPVDNDTTVSRETISVTGNSHPRFLSRRSFLAGTAGAAGLLVAGRSGLARQTQLRIAPVATANTLHLAATDGWVSMPPDCAAHPVLAGPVGADAVRHVRLRLPQRHRAQRRGRHGTAWAGTDQRPGAGVRPVRRKRQQRRPHQPDQPRAVDATRPHRWPHHPLARVRQRDPALRRRAGAVHLGADRPQLHLLLPARTTPAPTCTTATSRTSSTSRWA